MLLGGDMLKIFALRKNTNNDGTFSKFIKDIESIKSIVDNADNFLTNNESKLGGDYNIFITLASYKKGAYKRNEDTFEYQDIIGFDIDKINTDKLDKYIEAFSKATGIKDNFYAVCSGNGIHIAIKPVGFKLESIKDFKKYEGYYIAWCDLIEKEFDEAGLEYEEVDTQFFQPHRLLRFCKGRNIKPYETAPEGTVKEIKLLRGDIAPIEWDFFSITPMKREKDKYISKNGYGTPDKEYILEQCEFLKWAKENQAEVKEPQWVSALSIVGHFNDDYKTAIEISNKHPDFDEEKTLEKVKRYTKEHGPIKCSTVDSLSDKCKTCPHNGKVTSPIQLKSATHISSSGCGFTLTTKKGYARQFNELQRHFANKFSYVVTKDTDSIYVFDGKKYYQVEDTEIKKFAQENFDNPVCEKESERVEFLKQVKACGRQVSRDFFNLKNGVVNFNNCIYFIDSGEYIPHSPDYGFLYVLDYDYIPEAKCPTWDLLLKNLTVGRQGLIDTLEEFTGYILSGDDYFINKMLLLSGEGNNGKTTFINAMRSLCGEGNYSNIAARKFTSSFHTSAMYGKLANFSEETGKDSFRDTDLFKELTGDGEVTAEKKYEDAFSFRNRAKLVFAYNSTPYFGEQSKGIRRRLLIVPFDADLERNPELKIKNIKQKILDERSGIFNRVIAAYKRIKESECFTETEDSKREARDAIIASDPVLDLIENHMEYSEGAEVTTTQMWEYFQKEVDPRERNNRSLTYLSFCRRLHDYYKNSTKIFRTRSKDGRGFRNLDFINKTTGDY